MAVTKNEMVDRRYENGKFRLVVRGQFHWRLIQKGYSSDTELSLSHSEFRELVDLIESAKETL